MTLLALDPGMSSSDSGWAVWRDGAVIASGTLRSGPKRRKAESLAETHGRWLAAIQEALADVITEHQPTRAVIEYGGGTLGQLTLERVRGVMLATCYVRDLEIELVNVNRWLAWAKARGRTKDDKGDQADAEWLARYVGEMGI